MKYNDLLVHCITDPSIFNSFAATAYRFGHSMIQGIIKMYTDAGVFREEYPFSENFFNLERYKAESGLKWRRFCWV